MSEYLTTGQWKMLTRYSDAETLELHYDDGIVSLAD